MRLIMMGTGPFAVPTFRALYDTEHALAALVTGPVKRDRRGRALANPMRSLAEARGTPILDPASVNTDDARRDLAALEADLLVVCDFGQILSAETLATACRGGINLHSSLLPKYRGAAPIQWAVYHGDRETGVSVIHMTPKLDAGPVIAQSDPVAIGHDETAEELEPRLAKIGAPLTLDAIAKIAAGRAEPIPQDPALASKAPRIQKSFGQIDWARPAEAIRNHIRAMQPWPKAFTYWHRPGVEPMRLIVGSIAAEPSDGNEDVPAGTVREADDQQVVVQTGDGLARLKTLQPAGKRLMPIGEFQRGYRMQPGERLGQP